MTQSLRAPRRDELTELFRRHHAFYRGSQGDAVLTPLAQDRG